RAPAGTAPTPPAPAGFTPPTFSQCPRRFIPSHWPLKSVSDSVIVRALRRRPGPGHEVSAIGPRRGRRTFPGGHGPLPASYPVGSPMNTRTSFLLASAALALLLSTPAAQAQAIRNAPPAPATET